MNKLVTQELDNIKFANLSNYNPETKEYFIPKKVDIKLENHKCYLIKLSTSITHPSPNSILASNWNNGSIPNCQYYVAEVENIMGKMVKINGRGYNEETQSCINSFWNGWLPILELEIIKVL